MKFALVPEPLPGNGNVQPEASKTADKKWSKKTEKDHQSSINMGTVYFCKKIIVLKRF